MKNPFKALVAGLTVLALSQFAGYAQTLATYTVVGPQYYYPPDGSARVETNAAAVNDGNATVQNPDDVTPTQSVVNAVIAPASQLTYNPQPAPNSPNGLGQGYPFGYTVSAESYYYPTSLAGAESQGTYLTFTISPSTGNLLRLSGINLSTASFSSDFAGATSSNEYNGDPNIPSGYFVSLTSSVDHFSSALSTTAFNYTTAGNMVNLGSAFSNLTSPTTFHLDFYGTPNGTISGEDEAAFVYLTLSDGSVITIDGISKIIPEPGTYGLMAVGLAFTVVLVRSRRQARV